MSEPVRTVAELDALLLEEGAKVDAAKEKLRKLKIHRDLVHAREEVARKFNLMTPAEREAMRQHLTGAGSIPSAEAVGTIGSSSEAK